MKKNKPFTRWKFAQGKIPTGISYTGIWNVISALEILGVNQVTKKTIPVIKRRAKLIEVACYFRTLVGFNIEKYIGLHTNIRAQTASQFFKRFKKDFELPKGNSPAGVSHE